jgi:hypothetical protein
LPGQPGRRVNQVIPGHGLSYFFINPAQFLPQIDRITGQPAEPDRISKLSPAKYLVLTLGDMHYSLRSRVVETFAAGRGKIGYYLTRKI